MGHLSSNAWPQPRRGEERRGDREERRGDREERRGEERRREETERQMNKGIKSVPDGKRRLFVFVLSATEQN